MNILYIIIAALTYDKETGLISWRVDLGAGRPCAGAEAGCITSDGYRRIMLNGASYLSHRIAWALTHGSWPAGQIDHIDGCRTNNRIANLRDVTNSTNQQNLKRARRNNRSGSSVPGVCWHKASGKFKVNAQREGKTITIGRYATLPEAEAASLAYRRGNYEGFTL